MENKKSLSRYLLPTVMVGLAASNLASGGGFERVCVPIGGDEVQCVKTSKVERYLSGMGAGFALPSSTRDSLLVCGGGLIFGSTAGEVLSEGIFRMDIPEKCSTPEKQKGAERYGPKSETGGEFCNGRTSPDGCKDCCLSVALAQGAMVAAAGKMFRDTKPGAQGLAADAVAELASYGLIFWSRHACNDNCEISYERGIR